MPSKPGPSLFEIVEEAALLVGGLVVAGLPFFVLSAPVIFPALVLGGALATVVGLLALVAGVAVGLPVLAVRQLVRLRRSRATPPATPGG
jgi:hypothetical protein